VRDAREEVGAVQDGEFASLFSTRTKARARQGGVLLRFFEEFRA